MCLSVECFLIRASVRRLMNSSRSFRHPSSRLKSNATCAKVTVMARGFAEAFARLMARLFKDYGVVLMDPLDEELKQVVAPLYSKAIEKSSEIAEALVGRSRELERAGYHAQVHVLEDMTPLFIMNDGRRLAMTQSEGRFFVKGADRSFDKEELVQLARRCPNCFSPNVTLRPVVQDFLLPTAAYIGGPAEVAYFAQIRAVYETLERELPCVLPRASFTIIEGRHQKTLKKHNLELKDFFEGLQHGHHKSGRAEP